MERAMGHYIRLTVTAVLSFLAMYVLMYAMVDRLGDVYPNINQFYMAALMAAPMVLIELALMGSMYTNKAANAAIIAVSLVVLVGAWILIRQQSFVGDRQFLKSMIPHHSGAILMCERAPVQDAEIKKLCRSIVESQRSEIEEMRTILKRLGGAG
jgi:small-conductance mechanosensitive channel